MILREETKGMKKKRMMTMIKLTGKQSMIYSLLDNIAETEPYSEFLLSLDDLRDKIPEEAVTDLYQKHFRHLPVQHKDD